MSKAKQAVLVAYASLIIAFFATYPAFADEPLPHDKQYFVGSWLNSHKSFNCFRFPKHIEIAEGAGNGLNVSLSSYADESKMEKASDSPVLIDAKYNVLSVLNAKLEILKPKLMLAWMGAITCEFDKTG